MEKKTLPTENLEQTPSATQCVAKGRSWHIADLDEDAPREIVVIDGEKAEVITCDTCGYQWLWHIIDEDEE